jgi:hypothetical protein
MSTSDTTPKNSEDDIERRIEKLKDAVRGLGGVIGAGARHTGQVVTTAALLRGFRR